MAQRRFRAVGERPRQSRLDEKQREEGEWSAELGVGLCALKRRGRERIHENRIMVPIGEPHKFDHEPA